MQVITPSQCRAARGLLKWNQQDLAKKSSVHFQTICSFEKDVGSPTQRTLMKIATAFEKEGIELSSGEGVKKMDTNIRILNGEEGLKALFDDIYDSSLYLKEDILIANNEEPTYQVGKVMPYLMMHLDRLAQAGIKERILCCEGDTHFLGPVSAYRWVKKEDFCNNPTFIYANKIALLVWGPPPKVTIISNPMYAESVRHLFNIAWNNAKKPKLTKK